MTSLHFRRFRRGTQPSSASSAAFLSIPLVGPTIIPILASGLFCMLWQPAKAQSPLSSGGTRTPVGAPAILLRSANPASIAAADRSVALQAASAPGDPGQAGALHLVLPLSNRLTIVAEGAGVSSGPWREGGLGLAVGLVSTADLMLGGRTTLIWQLVDGYAGNVMGSVDLGLRLKAGEYSFGAAIGDLPVGSPQSPEFNPWLAIGAHWSDSSQGSISIDVRQDLLSAASLLVSGEVYPVRGVSLVGTAETGPMSISAGVTLLLMPIDIGVRTTWQPRLGLGQMVVSRLRW